MDVNSKLYFFATVWDKTCGRAGAPIGCTEVKLASWEEGEFCQDLIFAVFILEMVITVDHYAN